MESQDTGALECFRHLRIQRALRHSGTQNTEKLGTQALEEHLGTQAIRQFVVLYLDIIKSGNIVVSFFRFHPKWCFSLDLCSSFCAKYSFRASNRLALSRKSTEFIGTVFPHEMLCKNAKKVRMFSTAIACKCKFIFASTFVYYFCSLMKHISSSI